MDLTSVSLLLILGLVTAAQAQDCFKPVPGANMGLKGTDSLLTAFPDGTRVSFACNIGYMSAGGSSSITCTAGTWSPVRLKCERKNCGTAGEVPNGNIDYSEGTEFGDKVVVSCNVGFNLVGQRELLCGDQGWMGRLPVCEVTSCDPPPVIQYGAYDPVKEDYVYLEVVVYTCQKDYTLNGSKSSTCSEDGHFKPGPPECVDVTCVTPVVNNSVTDGGFQPYHKYLSTVTFRCHTGYEMVGAATVTCDINRQWSPKLPTCKSIPTTKAPTTTTTTTTTATTTTRPSLTAPKPTPEKPGSGADPFKQYGLPILIIFVLIALAGVTYWCYKKKSGKPQSGVL